MTTSARFAWPSRRARNWSKNGATVKLTTYEGGHGWRAGLYDQIRTGLQWLEKNHATHDRP